MRRALVPVFVAALTAAAAIGCHRDNNADNTGTTDTIQTGGAGVVTNSSGGASPELSTTAPVPGSATGTGFPTSTTGTVTSTAGTTGSASSTASSRTTT